ncbi:MAG: hypothetical protein E6H77_02310 [Betaproteobacteria bacterium]|nr:MAG: hypothetical protein E6H77_02310 [Betaproteobacteria bacterium]
MSRTHRRRGERHDYDRVLRDSCSINGTLVTFRIDARSKEGRRAIARFHSEAYWTLRSIAPRWYRRIFDHRLRTFNARQLRRSLDDPDYDPVFEVRHRHNANWSWW